MPTYIQVEHGLVVGVIAGGDNAIRKAVEFAEDDPNLGWQDLQEFLINERILLLESLPQEQLLT